MVVVRKTRTFLFSLVRVRSAFRTMVSDQFRMDFFFSCLSPLPCPASTFVRLLLSPANLAGRHYS